MPAQFRPTPFSRRRFLQTTVTAASGMALSSCGWTLAKVRSAPAQATTESKKVLYIYTWSGYTDDDLLNRFEQDTGIRVVADVFDSNDAMLARLQALGGGQYSIIYPSDYMVQKMVELGLLYELDQSRLKGLDTLFPRFQNPAYDPYNRYSIPLSWGTTGLLYNPQKLSGVPDDWDFLWDNRSTLAKRMTLLNDMREVIGAVLKSLGHSYNSKDPDHLLQAYEKLKEIKPFLASFTTDAWRTQILSGDLALSMVYSADASEISEENNQLRYIIPKSGSSLWTDTLVIPVTAPNVEGAYAWMNFMLRPDVAAQICERLSFATPSQTAFAKLPPEVAKNPIMFPPEDRLAQCEGVAPLGRFNEVYEAYWTRLTSG